MRYINHPPSLADVITSLKSSTWAAVDTEADSLHHYVEKLCLMQISTPSEDWVIDPLVPLDLGGLVLVLSQKPLILHGADFDLRILKKTYGFVPSNIFDTMIAAQLLGYEKQGLSDLALKHCGVSLPKSAQKADWSERPLDEKLLAYAANDTHYLKQIADIMGDELAVLGRLEWHRQTCQKLIRTIQLSKEDRTDPAMAWQVKGSRELKGSALTILKELWRWREAEARRRDRPSFKIMNSEILVDIARWSGENSGLDVALMPNLPCRLPAGRQGRQERLPRSVRNQYRDSINEVIQRAKAMPQAQYARKTVLNKSKPWTEASKKWFDLMKAERDKIAAELKIQPSLLATNAVLETLSLAAPKNREALQTLGCLLPWQIDVMGEIFFGIINSNESR